MSESLKRKLHDDIVSRWVHVRTPGHKLYGKPDYDDSHIQSLDIGGGMRRFDPTGARLVGTPDELRSYGPHFPLVQAIRGSDGRGPVRLWLLNGDRWGGQSGFGKSTSGQQAQVRTLVQATDIPHVILPFSAIDAARIEHASIRVLSETPETFQTVTHGQTEEPEGIEWVAKHEMVTGTGYGTRIDGTYGRADYATMEDIPSDILAYFNADGSERVGWREPVVTHFGRRHRDWGAPRPRRDYTTGPIEWNGYAKSFYVPPVYVFSGMTPSDEWKRDANGDMFHWTREDSGEWVRETRIHTLGGSVFRAAYRGDNGKRYFANFLSAVDSSPHGSGYFLVQLPGTPTRQASKLLLTH